MYPIPESMTANRILDLVALIGVIRDTSNFIVPLFVNLTALASKLINICLIELYPKISRNFRL
jgi:hypothetical protein